MGFASSWLEQRALFPEFISEAPDKQTGIIVVVPAYNEPGITEMLDSLALCREPDCSTEVIIVVNAPEDAPEEHIRNNKLTISNIESWKMSNNNCFFRLFCIQPPSVIPRWGVGMARKTGMDEALRRFNSISKPDGVILCLDADCTVEPGYFVAVCNDLLKRKDRQACSISFGHPVEGGKFPGSVYESITLYELHLRYFFQGLKFSGFPYVFHTIGSAMAVKAHPYLKAGGMNRKQAGEDFYFIQKLIPAGGYFSLNSTMVIPSPRTSFRVPFGTGATMEKLSKENSSGLLTYNLRAFRELKQCFSDLDKFFHSAPVDIPALYTGLPYGVRLFSPEDEWTNKIKEIRENTSGLASFRKRFFGWFNMFRIVKYLNLVHQEYLEKKPVTICAAELLDETGVTIKENKPVELLKLYRSMENDY